MNQDKQDYPSADGERAAQIGYYPQYCIAADKIYQGILEGTFESVSITDPTAGIVDDFIIFSIGRVDAYQIKWTEQKGYTSFKDFIRGSTGTDSLFGKLAHGWKYVSEKHKKIDTFVHLIEYNLPSTNKAAKVEIEGHNFDGTFREFVLSWNNKTLFSNEKNKPFLIKLSEYIGFDIKHLEKFYKFSYLHFGYSNPLETLFTSTQKREDYLALFHLVQQCAGGQTRVINLVKNDLITKLNWNNRFETQFSHKFPSPIKYEPIQATIIELKTIMKNISSGYIALTGSPGSGKSTTLSQYFMENKLFCYVPYYAFIPDSYNTSIRGESSSFFSDVTIELDKWGFKGNIGLIPKTHNDFKIKFEKQLSAAHEKYINDGTKTVILIDGLDHIDREQNPHISLIKDLPPPENIPDGVVILLGSQTLLLNDMLTSIKNQLSKNGRTLVIKSLTKIQIFNLLDKHGLSKLQENEKEIIFQKTSGNPLFLTYTIQLLKQNQNINILDQYENFTDSIENMYISTWEQIKTNQNVINILAIVSRFRLPFEPDKFLSFAARQDLILFDNKFSHYFKKEKYWSFYHNSLRQFLLQKTKETPFGNQDETKNKEYFLMLSELLLKTDNEIARWELIYSLFHAGEEQKILEIATQYYFREQYFNLRPYNDIKNDISILLHISKKNMNFNILLRCLLIEKELRDRDSVLEEINIVTLLYNTYGVSYFLALLQNQTTNYSIPEFFQIALLLYQNGFIEESKAIYEQHIPLQYLVGSVPYVFNHHGKDGILDSWIEVALLFEPISRIIKYIEQTKIDKSNLFEQDEIDHVVLHKHLINQLSKELINFDQPCKIIDFIDICNSNYNYTNIIFNMCLQIECKKLFMNETELHEKTCSTIVNYSSNNELYESESLKLAEFYFNTNNIEKSNFYVGTVSQITAKRIDDHSKKDFFYKTIRLNRLLSGLGISNNPQNMIPDPENDHYLGNALYLRILVIFSQFEGIINRGGIIGIYDFKKNVEYAIRLFQRPFNETREWYSWYLLENTFSDFYQYIIYLGSKIGSDCIETLKEIFIKSWNSNAYWLLDTKRIIIVELIKHGASTEDLISILNDLFDIIKSDSNASTRVSSYSDFINTFSKLKIKKDFHVLFRDLLQGSFAINDRKDYQIQDWIFWLELYAKTHQEKAMNDMERFIFSLSNLYNEKGGDNSEAIRRVLCLIASINPNKAYRMFKLLLNEGTCDYSETFTGFVSGILAHDPSLIIECFAIFQKLIIPFNPASSSEIIKNFIKLLYANFTPNEVNEIIFSLIKVIDTELISTSRRKWLTDIKSELLRYNQEKTVLDSLDKSIEMAPEKKESEYSQIKYIRKDFKNFNELNSYLKGNDKEENLDMHYIVENLIESITSQDIEIIKEMIANGIFEARKTIVICQKIEKILNKNVVEELLESCLRTTDNNGWSVHWNGAPRLLIFKELIRINSDKWKKAAFEDFVNTYLNVNRYPYYYLYDWENINSIFNNNMEFFIEEYWNEMTNHIYELNDFVNSNKNVIPEYIDDSNETTLSIIIKVVVYFLKLPVPDFQLKSHQALISILEKNIDKQESVDCINSLLDFGGLVTNKALALIDCLSDKYCEFVKLFELKLINLAIDSDISIRFQSNKILSKFSINIPEIKYKALPGFYSLLFDDDFQFGNKDIGPHEVLPNATSLRDFLRIFDSEVKILSKITRIEYSTIGMRIMMIAKQLEPEEMWDEKAEKKLGKWLHDINQTRRYHRPRPQIIKRALNIVVGELLDANEIPDNYLPLVTLSIANRFNKYLSLISPIALPDVFKSNPFIIEWKNDMHKKKADWIDNINLDMHELLLHHEDKIIIGAYTIFSYFEWGEPTQIDVSCICLNEMAENFTETDDLLLKIDSSIHYSSDIYPKTYFEMPESLVIHCFETSVDHCGISWLAFNPEIALRLNWKFDKSEKLFRWIDLFGETMIESIYFKDGSLELQPPKTDLFCSEGWYVIASKEAFDQIMKIYDNLHRINYSKRSYIEGKENKEKSIYRKGLISKDSN